jgi:hypothetical protein
MLQIIVFLFQSFLNNFYKFKSKFITINKINYNKQSLIWKYYLLLTSHFFKLLFINIPLFDYLFINLHHLLVNKIDKKLDLVKIEITNGSIIRNILFTDFFIEFLLDKDFYNDYISNKRIYDNNELITSGKEIILDIILKDNNSENSIGELLKNYADKSGYFRDNTILNILKYKSIDYTNDTMIEIVKLANFRRVKHIDNIKNRSIFIR